MKSDKHERRKSKNQFRITGNCFPFSSRATFIFFGGDFFAGAELFFGFGELKSVLLPKS
jgi:hypothetical protein